MMKSWGAHEGTDSVKKIKVFLNNTDFNDEEHKKNIEQLEGMGETMKVSGMTLVFYGLCSILKIFFKQKCCCCIVRLYIEDQISNLCRTRNFSHF